MKRVYRILLKHSVAIFCVLFFVCDLSYIRVVLCPFLTPNPGDATAGVHTLQFAQRSSVQFALGEQAFRCHLPRLLSFVIYNYSNRLCCNICNATPN